MTSLNVAASLFHVEAAEGLQRRVGGRPDLVVFFCSAVLLATARELLAPLWTFHGARRILPEIKPAIGEAAVLSPQVEHPPGPQATRNGRLLPVPIMELRTLCRTA